MSVAVIWRPVVKETRLPGCSWRTAFEGRFGGLPKRIQADSVYHAWLNALADIGDESATSLCDALRTYGEIDLEVQW